jgi:hypothetical protein
VRRQPDRRLLAGDGAHRRRGEIVLADMHSICAGQPGDVRPNR